MRGFTLLAAIGATLALVPAGAPSEAAAKPAGRIVYAQRFWPQSDRLVDNWELFIRPLGRSQFVRLTRNPRCDDVFPSWSHDGRRIAFACGWGLGAPAGIFVMRDDGSGRRRVGKLTARITGTAWSPDDTKIAVGTRSGIWVLNADGSARTRLTRGDDSYPTWSSDGRMLAYQHQSGPTRETWDDEIWVVRADGTGRRRIVRRAHRPDWSPDGRRIVFLRAPDIWVMNADGRGQRRLRCCRRDGVADVTWSPDSRYLAYDGGSGLDAGVHVMPVEAKRGPSIAGGEELLGFDWGPDPPS